VPSIAHFHSTLPADATALMRMSEFERQQGPFADAADVDAGATRLSSLNPSLLQDLARFHPSGDQGLDLLEVLAASLRHCRPLRLHLQLGDQVIPLTVWPAEGELHSPMPLSRWLGLRLSELRVLRVEPAPMRVAVDSDDELPPSAAPLAPLLWELALRGSRASLLPEIDGIAAYRVVPGADLRPLDLAGSLTGSLAHAVNRMREQARPLREIAAWPGLDRDRAMRLLNGLYLQAALMISRAHPSVVV